MRFAYTEWYWLLLCVPALYLLGRWRLRIRAQRLSAFADDLLLPQLSANFQRIQSRVTRAHFWSAATALLLVSALLRPQWGFTWKESSRTGVDILIAVDVSESMLATDVRPSRLTRAKREILDLLDTLQGDRVGLVSFAGTAYVESPLTLDYGAFRVFLSALSPELIPVGGTNIEAAILESIKAFSRGIRTGDASLKTKRDKAIILITDGEDFEGDFTRIAEISKEDNIRLYVFGIGTPDGSPIPSNNGYKKDKKGRVVVTRLREEALAQLAKNTGGVYVRSIHSERDTDAVYELGIRKQLEAARLDYGNAKRWNEYFQIPLALALLCLLFGPWVSAGELFQKTLSNSSLGFFLFLWLWPALVAHAESAEALGERGHSAYKEGRYQDALSAFSEGASEHSEDYRFKLGEGASLYRMEKFEEAETAFLEAAARTSNEASKANALFNAGNAMVQLESLDDAVKTFERALKVTPNDKEIQDNLEYAKMLLRRKEKKKDDSSEQDSKKNKKGESGKEKQNKSGKGDKEKNEKNKEQDKNKSNKSDDNKKNSGSDKKDPADSSKQGSKEKKNEESKSSEKDKKDQSKESGQREKEEKKPKPDEDKKSGSQKNEDNKKKEDKERGTGLGSGAKNTDNQQQLSAQGEAALHSIEEKAGKRMEFRMKEATQQLQQQERKAPEKDW